MLWTMQSASYKDLPRFEGNPRKTMPIPTSKLESFDSEFIGKTLDELAEFLKQSPDDLQINRQYFVVVDGETKKRGKMCLCKIEAGKVATFRRDIDDAGLAVGNLTRPGKWEEMKENAEPLEEREKERES